MPGRHLPFYPDIPPGLRQGPGGRVIATPPDTPARHMEGSRPFNRCSQNRHTPVRQRAYGLATWLPTGLRHWHRSPGKLGC